jgi:pyridoxamine 5'-phosphate oxidase
MSSSNLKPESSDEQSSPSPLISHPAGTKAAQFTKDKLTRSDLLPTPEAQFATWFAAANDYPIKQAEGCTLSTASLPSGKVSARTVYLKGVDARGFVVYTNLGTSHKAADLASNPHAALTFWWRELERQVRVEGVVEHVSREETQAYFDTRIRGSRIGAWASRQSAVLKDGREELEEQVKEVEDRFKDQEKIPAPQFWGGIRIVPEEVEFWQGRESRLHDRFKYRWQAEGDGWTIERLNP